MFEEGNAKLLGEARLARHARRSASNEAQLCWFLLGGVFSVLSFPVRWYFDIPAITLPIGILIGIGLAAVVGLAWYVRAKREIEGFRIAYQEMMSRKNARIQEEHLQNLRDRQKN